MMKKKLIKLTALLAALVLMAQLFALSAFALKAAFLGDVNLDGALDPGDARLALRIAIGLEGASTAQKKLSDVDSDKEITPADARLILRAAVGLESAFRIQFVFTDAELNDGPEKPTPTQPTPSQPYPQVPDDSKPGQGGTQTPQTGTVPKPVASTQSGTFTFVSYGWGDGVGMPQYGAVSLAKSGYSCEQILKHYFTGVKIVTNTDYPETTDYLGEYCNTDELIARMVYMEMYGIVDDNPSVAVEALKAQAVCLFTLLKYHSFSTANRYEIGVASGKSYSSLPEILKNAVRSVRGQYLTLENSANNAPIQALYGAISAGRTASAKDVWGEDYPYLQSVSSPLTTDSPSFSNTFYFSKEQMRDIIKSYDSSIVLQDDPSQWIKIVSHSASIDADRGYVTKIQVGNKVLDGYFGFCDGMMRSYFWSTRYFNSSTCFCVMYTP